MSQEERDLRLGLTGLSPTERAQRIAELGAFLEEMKAAAKAEHERQRAARLAKQQAESEHAVEDTAE